MENNNNLIPIPGRMHCVATEGVGLGADEIFDDAKGKRQSVINQETDTALDNKYDKDETYSKQELNNLITTPNQDYVTVPTYASLPATGEADTVYRVSNYDGEQSQVDATKYSEYAWDGTQYVFLCVKTQIGEVFDISVYHNNAKYTDLNDALTGTNGGVPSSLQKGGMSVKFVCSSDNKYVQYFCNSQTFTTDVSYWEKVNLEDEVSQLGQEVKSVTQEETYQITTTNQTITLPVRVKNGNKVNIKISSSTLPITRIVIAQNVNDTSHRIYDENVSSVDFTFTSTDDVSVYYFIIISSAADNDSVNVSVEYGEYLQEQIEAISEKTDSLQIDSDALSLKVNGLGESDFGAPPTLVYRVSDGQSSMNNYRYGSKIYKVKEGDIFNITLYNGDTLYTIVALNGQKELIAAKSVYGDLTNYKYRVEQGVKYLYFITSSTSIAKVKSWVEDNVLLDNVSYGNSIFTDGYCYLANGNLSANAGYSLSEFIPVNPGDVVFIDNINTTNSTLIIASFSEDDDNIIVGSSFVGGNINLAEKRVYKIPNNIRRIRVTKLVGDSATINILRRYNTQEYFNKQRNNILVDGFSSFDNPNWTVDTDKTFLSPTASASWSFSKDAVDYAEDNSVYCCRIVPLTFDGDNFEAGIGKATEQPYTGVTVYATIAKDSNGSYLKVYQYNFTDSVMEEVVAKRVSLSEAITIGNQYFLKIVKRTESTSTITIMATNSEGDIIGQTSSDNDQYWGAVTCFVYNGSARFDGLSFSIKKAINPKVSIVGDSFVEGSTVPTKTDRWCGMLAETIGADNCVIMGRGGASFTNDNKRFFAQLEKVNSCYTILEGVSNDMDYTYWLNGLQMLINLCLVNGSIPILTTYAPNDHDTSQHRQELINSVNQWVRNSGYIYFDVNKALSDDGVSFKTGYVLSDGIHPSQEGHLALFNRLKMDCPFLFE